MLLFGALGELGFSSFLDRMKLKTQLAEMIRDDANLRAYEPVYPCICQWLTRADIFVVWKAVPILVMWLSRADILVVWMKRAVQTFVMWLR